ncbi:26S proteasome regulatory subunit [Nitzschia inconspicua]|uniref:26S proteasome regulatory subunit n=1 Tax=Nitzschia inconspicua TaxID=303405 RepID=A0A9K3L4M6_9STRA|nr:26S proteasome regulatory subunit [Nitzschia inconspicua]
MSGETPPREYVESLLSKGAYKVSNQPTLEAYVDAQASGDGEYYFEANKALLKIYNSQKSLANTDKMATVLLLALVESYPSTDLLALSYLLPERYAASEPCKSVLECSELLDSCRFVEFWAGLSKIPTEDPSLKALVGRSTEKLQRGILQVLSFTYKSAKLDKVLTVLNLKDSAGLTQLKDPCLESVSGDTVVFKSTVDNTKRNRVFQEGLSYNAIANLMAKVSAE